MTNPLHQKFGLYAALGLSEAAANTQSGAEIRSCITSQEIRKAYLALAKLEHPDKQPTVAGESKIAEPLDSTATAPLASSGASTAAAAAAAAARFDLIHQAYETLYDESKRIVYNRTGSLSSIPSTRSSASSSGSTGATVGPAPVSHAAFVVHGVHSFFARFLAQQQQQQQQAQHQQQHQQHPFGFGPGAARSSFVFVSSSSAPSSNMKHGQRSSASGSTATSSGASSAPAAAVIRKIVEIDMESMLLPSFQRKYEIVEQLVCTQCQQTAHKTPLACSKCRGSGTVSNTITRTVEFGRHLDFRAPLVVPNVFSDAKSFEFQFVVKPHAYYTHPLSSSQVEVLHPGHLILHWRLSIADWAKCMKTKSRMLLSVPNLAAASAPSAPSAPSAAGSATTTPVVAQTGEPDPQLAGAGAGAAGAAAGEAKMPHGVVDTLPSLFLVLEECTRLQPHQIWHADGLGLWNHKTNARGTLFVMLDIDMSQTATSWPQLICEPKSPVVGGGQGAAPLATTTSRHTLTLTDTETAALVKWYNHVMWNDGNARPGGSASSARKP